MKHIFIIIITLICFSNQLISQEIKLPISNIAGHNISEWIIGDDIKARVMLESAYPIIVINEDFALKHLSDLVELKPASKGLKLGTWQNNKTVPVSYVIKDSIKINGQNVFIEAMVADYSNNKIWKSRDIMFPIADLPGKTLLNINDGFMIMNFDGDLSDFTAIETHYSEKVKGLDFQGNLKITDSLGTSEILHGKFIFDLGSPNALFINRKIDEVEEFIVRSDRFLIKDTSRFPQNPHLNMAVIAPKEYTINSLTVSESYVIARNLYGGKSKGYTGIIGNGFFKKFIVVFDFKSNTIYFKERD